MEQLQSEVVETALAVSDKEKVCSVLYYMTVHKRAVQDACSVFSLTVHHIVLYTVPAVCAVMHITPIQAVSELQAKIRLLGSLEDELKRRIEEEQEKTIMLEQSW